MTGDERRILFVLAAAHALNHAFIKLYPSLLDPIGAETASDVARLGGIASAQNLAYGIPALLAGWLAGRAGAGRMVRIYLFLAAGACGLAAFAAGPWGIAAVLFLLGLSCSLYHPAGLSIASRQSRAGVAMAVHGIGGNVGHVLAPSLAAALVTLTSLSWRLPYLVLGAAGLLLGLAALRALPRDGRSAAPVPVPAVVPDDPGGAPSRSGEIASIAGSETRLYPLFLLCALFFCQAISYYAYDTFITKHLAARLGAASPLLAARAGGFATAAAFAVGILGQIAGGKLAHRVPLERLFLASLAAGVPCLLLLAPLPGIACVFAAAAFAFTYFFNQPVGNLLVARYTSDRHRSLGYGLQFVATFGVGGMTASLSGIVARSFGFPAMFLAAGTLLALTTLLALPLLRHSRHHPAPAAAA